jgi:hypothetical protein
MLFKLNAYMQSFGEAGYIAWIDNSKNIKMVVQGKTPDEAAKELLISLKVTMSYMFGVDMDTIQEKECASDEELYTELLKDLRDSGKKELEFKVA